MSNKVINSIPPFIKSLHRPFNQNLKSNAWVCDFIQKKQSNLKSSEINIQFYIYLINFLYKNKKQIEGSLLTGLPSIKAISDVYDFLRNKDTEERIEKIQSILKQNRLNLLDKQIYSTYKAASYYVNMAKDKFELLNNNNQLNNKGIKLSEISHNNWKMNKAEKEFIFERIISCDALLIISICMFEILDYNNYNLYYKFLDDYFNIRHFNFTSVSLNNYNTVRRRWIKDLNVLNKSNKIRKNYMNIIIKNEQYNSWYNDIKSKFYEFKKNEYDSLIKYNELTIKFENSYFKSLESSDDKTGYVNLYKIKEDLNLSFDKMQNFINRYYENNKSEKLIFFSNIVNSIDKRKRFAIRKLPVLKIRIKK